jgi:hypothetical protein
VKRINDYLLFYCELIRGAVNAVDPIKETYIPNPVPGSLNKKGGRRCLPLFLFIELGTAFI